MPYATTDMEKEILGHIQKTIDCLSMTYGDMCATGPRDTVERREWIVNIMNILTDVKAEIECGILFKMSITCPMCGYTGTDVFAFPKDRCGIHYAYGCPQCRSLF